ncbi:hypothetical protein Q8W71_23840 [Methylobacterium sp. NEAU 140]|uniref:hypothetical protein n=1 Tax=Methylobacterium sp. NEAU 140 TaxID=3064945 RepID=UPI00273760E9|nr:hypothetical protein [Methylobacterium sp. NEAU 140]MDP4025671.1 hypothetical protein [Methylobacterium sp. NEAU 140]
MAGETTDTRAERLKAALRENLRRRKAQGRGRAEAVRPPDAERPDAPDRRGPDSDKTGL